MHQNGIRLLVYVIVLIRAIGFQVVRIPYPMENRFRLHATSWQPAVPDSFVSIFVGYQFHDISWIRMIWLTVA